MADPLPATIADLPFFVSGRFPQVDVIGRCRGGEIDTTPGRAIVERVRDLGLGLLALGLEPRDRVAIVSESRPEWLFADFAILAAGGVTVPIYPTLSVDQIAFILRDSGATCAIVSTPAMLDIVRTAARSLNWLRTIVVMDPLPNDTGEPSSPPVLTLDDVAARGHRRILDGWGVAREFADGAKRIAPGDLATIVYTSGTTGQPKGVLLTHENLMANIAGVKAVLQVDETDVALSFLPLCHAFERLVAYVYLVSGVSMIFAESLETIARDIARVRPTVMTGVPRVFEKMHARVVERGRQGGTLARSIFDWAVKVAIRRGRLPPGERPSGRLALESRLADRLVFRRIRDAVGGRARFFVSGSAALQVWLGEFYRGVGLPILEGYGMTETSPVVSVTPFDRIRPGSVGPPLPNVHVRVSADGELMVRGPSVSSGYLGRPVDTAALFEDGWLLTGDIGVIDEDGYLRITDRKKDLIVTSGGKKIAPQPVEAALCACDGIDQAVLVGTGRHFVAALIVPDTAALARHLGVTPPVGVALTSAFLARDDARGLVQGAVDRINEGLSQFERIKKIAIVPEPFTTATGELTPTEKVRRAVVERRHRDLIEALYEGAVATSTARTTAGG